LLPNFLAPNESGFSSASISQSVIKQIRVEKQDFWIAAILILAERGYPQPQQKPTDQMADADQRTRCGWGQPRSGDKLYWIERGLFDNKRDSSPICRVIAISL